MHKRFYFITITPCFCNACLEVFRYFSLFGRGETGTEVWKLRLEVTYDSCDSPKKVHRKANDVDKFLSVGLCRFTHEVMLFEAEFGKEAKVAFLINYTIQVVHNYFF